VKRCFSFILLLCFFATFLLVAENKTPKPTHKKLAPALKYTDYSILLEKNALIGFWRVVKWHAYFYVPAKEWNKPAFMKFQWYLFEKNGSIKFMTAHKDFANDVVLAKISKNNTDLMYSFDSKGMMRISNPKKKEINELWRTALITKNIDFETTGFKFLKGDVVQSLLDKNNKILYVRQMRKISP
jgi:hypothetical protein